MDTIDLIITPIAGSVIGYITNWLAIKMLFRPYNEKKILNIKIPFTPGLIPKEQSRIAVSIGEAIGEHLLTEDAIVKALTDNSLKDKIRNLTDDYLVSIDKEEKSIYQVLNNITNNNADDLLDKLYEKISFSIDNSIDKEKLANRLNNIIINQINVLLEKRIISSEMGYYNVKEKLMDSLECILKSKDSKEAINKYVFEFIEKESEDVRKLGIIIDDVLDETIKEFIKNKSISILKYIFSILENQDIKNKLIGIINDYVTNNVGAFASMFVNGEKILNIIIEEGNKYLDDEEKNIGIVEYILDYYEKIKEIRVYNIIEKIKENIDKESIVYIIQKLYNIAVNKNNISHIFSHLEGNINKETSIKDVFSYINKDIDKSIEIFIYEKINEIIYNYITKENINNLLKSKIKLYINKDIKSIIKLDLLYRKKVQDIVIYNYIKLINEKSSYIVKALNISSIIENQINSFEVDYAEEIILSIVSKELNAITSLGALLGFMMGIFTLLIQKF